MVSPATTQHLMIEIFGVVIFTALTVVNAYVMYPTPQEIAKLDSDDVDLFFRITSGDAILYPRLWSSVLIFLVMSRQACVNQQHERSRSGAIVVHPAVRTRIGSAGSNYGVNSILADGVGEQEMSMRTRGAIIVDNEVLYLTAQMMFVYIATVLLWYAFFGIGGNFLVLFFSLCYFGFRFLPAAHRRWNPAGGDANLLGVPRRVVLLGPLSVLPVLAFPMMLKSWSPDDLTLMHPLFLSLVEYLMISVIFNDGVVAGYSDEALSILARFNVASIESSRIGIFVVVANSPTGTFGGLVNATVAGLVSEVLARNNLFSIPWRAFKYGVAILWSKLVSIVMCRPWEKPPRPELNEMQRLKRLHLGVKLDTEYWAVFVLILIKCVGWGYGGVTSPALDPDTGELLDVLNSPWRVIGVVVSGELAGDLLAMLLGMFITWCAPPEFHVSVPVVTPRHAGTALVMWLNVGGYCINGISAIGVLSDSLQVLHHNS